MKVNILKIKFGQKPTQIWFNLKVFIKRDEETHLKVLTSKEDKLSLRVQTDLLKTIFILVKEYLGHKEIQKL